MRPRSRVIARQAETRGVEIRGHGHRGAILKRLERTKSDDSLERSRAAPMNVSGGGPDLIIREAREVFLHEIDESRFPLQYGQQVERVAPLDLDGRGRLGFDGGYRWARLDLLDFDPRSAADEQRGYRLGELSIANHSNEDA